MTAPPAPDHRLPVSVIGLPYHLGSRGRASGYQMALGPEQLLEDKRLPAHLRAVFDDVEIAWVTDADEPTEQDTGGDFRVLPRGDQMARQITQILHLARAVHAERDRGRFPIGVVGNCSASLGMVGGLDDPGLGMIWCDAHSDAMTPETSTNGFFEGMPVSTIAGLCWPRIREQIPGFHEIPVERMITVGNHEIHWSGGRKNRGDHALGALVDPPAIAALGFAGAVEQALDRLTAHTGRVYIHVDADVFDPQDLRGNSHCAPGGIPAAQMYELVDRIADRVEISGLTLGAYDPDVDPRGPEVLVPFIVHATRAAARSRRHAVTPS